MYNITTMVKAKMKPNAKVDPLAKKIKALTDKGMPPKMAKIVAAKQMKKAEAPMPKGKKPAMFKAKAKPKKK